MQKNQYLIIPSRPTPNGHLHLGHIAGPYLRADILARHLNRLGHQATLISGSDVYEHYVLLKAYLDKKSPSSLATFYHQAIEKDLKLMNINIHSYINVLDESFNSRFIAILENLLILLQKNNALIEKKESFLQSIEHQRPILGSWLLGTCPHCHHKMGGFFCEKCGMHHNPQQLKNIQPRFDWLCTQFDSSCVYLKIQHPESLLNYLHISQLPKRYIDVVHEYLKTHHNYFRINHPCEWGIPFQNQQNSVWFSAASILSYCILFGEKYSQLTGTKINPFSTQSNIITITTFGTDALIPYLIGTVGLSFAVQEFKPPDHFIINSFYTLEGQKFSTSLGHAIWVKDIISLAHGNSDVIRYYLAHAKLDDQADDFKIGNFLTCVNKEYSEIVKKINYAFTKISKLHTHTPSHQDKFEILLNKQSNFLDPNHFIPHLGIHFVKDWVEHLNYLQHPHDYYWWLRNLSILIYPFTPKLATTIWHSLGLSNYPSLEADISHTSPCIVPPKIENIQITLKGLAACLPKTLA